ncbi:addiction module toxin RelE [Yersinia rochesterensis]|uniref:Addiction module toxin RelE n=1 Tax=Yersinia rochesterensis TaxID=1604335 RepID=A0A8D4N220_9GAMM|nr:addiction module toxin RelE [Yersinia rochesterensis]
MASGLILAKDYPKSLASPVGSKQTNPDELTQVSDSGECVPLTPRWL